MRLLIAIPFFCASVFLAVCFLYASVLMIQGRTGPFTDKYGWLPLIVVHAGMFITSGSCAWIGLAILRRK
jgi:hypothetical protein